MIVTVLILAIAGIQMYNRLQDVNGVNNQITQALSSTNTGSLQASSTFDQQFGNVSDRALFALSIDLAGFEPVLKWATRLEERIRKSSALKKLGIEPKGSLADEIGSLPKHILQAFRQKDAPPEVQAVLSEVIALVGTMKKAVFVVSRNLVGKDAVKRFPAVGLSLTATSEDHAIEMLQKLEGALKSSPLPLAVTQESPTSLTIAQVNPVSNETYAARVNRSGENLTLTVGGESAPTLFVEDSSKGLSAHSDWQEMKKAALPAAAVSWVFDSKELNEISDRLFTSYNISDEQKALFHQQFILPLNDLGRTLGSLNFDSGIQSELCYNSPFEGGTKTEKSDTLKLINDKTILAFRFGQSVVEKFLAKMDKLEEQFKSQEKSEREYKVLTLLKGFHESLGVKEASLVLDAPSFGFQPGASLLLFSSKDGNPVQEAYSAGKQVAEELGYSEEALPFALTEMSGGKSVISIPISPLFQLTASEYGNGSLLISSLPYRPGLNLTEVSASFFEDSVELSPLLQNLGDGGKATVKNALLKSDTSMIFRTKPLLEIGRSFLPFLNQNPNMQLTPKDIEDLMDFLDIRLISLASERGLGNENTCSSSLTTVF